MESVITINNWWDGPLTGLAYYDEHLCIYEGIFDESVDDYIDEYYLTPITDHENDEIMTEWQEWCNACSNGDLELFYKKHLKNNSIDRVLINSKSRRKHRKKRDLKDDLKMALFLLIIRKNGLTKF